LRSTSRRWRHATRERVAGASENQRDEADDDEQSDQENNTGRRTKEFQHDRASLLVESSQWVQFSCQSRESASRGSVDIEALLIIANVRVNVAIAQEAKSLQGVTGGVSTASARARESIPLLRARLELLGLLLRQLVDGQDAATLGNRAVHDDAIESKAADTPVTAAIVEPDHRLELQPEARLCELDVIRPAAGLVNDEIALIESLPIPDQPRADAVGLALGRYAVARVRRRRRGASGADESSRYTNEHRVRSHLEHTF